MMLLVNYVVIMLHIFVDLNQEKYNNFIRQFDFFNSTRLVLAYYVSVTNQVACFI